MARPRKGHKGDKEATSAWHGTMRERYGDADAVHKHMQELGRKGGQASTTGGFYANRKLASEAGRRGGRKAKRGWKIIKETPMFITYKRTNGEETMRVRKEELGVI